MLLLLLFIMSFMFVNVKSFVMYSNIKHVLHVPQYQPSIYKSTKQFGLSFAYDAPKIWNELPDDVRSATSIASFRKKLKAYLFCQAYPP